MKNHRHSPIASIGSKRLLIVSALIIFGIGFLTHCGPSTEPSPKMKVDSDIITADIQSPSDTMFITNTAWQVPHDVSSSNPTQAELARFAWKEFIALNWPSSYKTDGKRGTPDMTKTALDFARVGQDPNLPLVWQTYMHRVELFPHDQTKFPTSFDVPPHYYYEDDIPNLENPGTFLTSQDTIFNNLDETSEINLCTVFTTGDSTAPGADSSAPTASFLPGAPRRVIYEAKANRVFYEYVRDNELYDTLVKKGFVDFTNRAISNATPADTFGGVYPCPPGVDSLICFPHGVASSTGSEGSIEVKASWRQLSEAEFNSGRFLTAPIIYYRQGTPTNFNDPTVYYQVVSGEVTATERPFGLVGLHIIHKTQHVPTYVFATFEQVDNLNDTLPDNDLFLYNRNWNVVVDSSKQVIRNRIHNITSTTMAVNAQVHAQVKALDANSVWQYYKLIGTQGPASNNQDTTNYLLANIVTETNEVLANFVGTLDKTNGVIANPNGVNVHKGSNSFVMGGCKGCHGNSQKSDFSFITADGPFDEVDVVNQPLLIQDPTQTGGPLVPSGTVVSF